MRWHGIAGLVMIVIAELALFFNIPILEGWYFPIVWFGFIFFIDGIVYRLSSSSLVMNHPKKFIWLLFLSAVFWWIFEFINLGIQNWTYTSGRFPSSFNAILWRTLCFSTVLPALFELSGLFEVLHYFEKSKLHHVHRISKRFLSVMIIIGVVSLILPILLPKYFFFLTWCSFFFLLDPINYIHGEPSIIKHLKDRKLGVPFTLLVAGIMMGLLWEYWNYWAPNKWTYAVPFVGFLKIFEMPLLGYLGYFPFAFELYAMYHFVEYYVKKIENKVFNRNTK